MTPTPVNLTNLYNPASRITDISIAGILRGFSAFYLIFFLIGAFFLGSLLYASLKYITSEGDPKKVSDATKRITNSLIGLIIVFASFVIVRIVAGIFGYESIVPIQ